MNFLRGLALISLFLCSGLAQASEPHFEVKSTNVKTEKSEFTVVSFEGSLLEGSGAALIAELEKATTQRIVLELNSDGGRLKEADQIKLGMDKIRATGKDIDTFVANGSSCQSACTILFMYSPYRMAGETAAFMFHAVQYESLRGVRDSLQTSLLINYYTRQGLSPEWIKDRQKDLVFSGVNDYWVSGKSAYEQKIGLVTASIPALVYHTPAPIDPQIRPR